MRVIKARKKNTAFFFKFHITKNAHVEEDPEGRKVCDFCRSYSFGLDIPEKVAFAEAKLLAAAEEKRLTDVDIPLEEEGREF